MIPLAHHLYHPPTNKSTTTDNWTFLWFSGIAGQWIGVCTLYLYD